MRVLGTRSLPIGWRDRTTGLEQYVPDLPESTLVVRTLRSPVPHGRIVELDVSPALGVEGCVGVITADDFPSDVRYIHLGGEYSDRRPLAKDFVRYVGEEIAAVAAESEEAADQAIRRIRLRIRPLRAALSVEEALRPDAPILHDRPVPNVAAHMEGKYGATERQATDRYVEGEYRYPIVAHASLEPHSILASWDHVLERLDVWASTQAPYFVRLELAHVLGLEPTQVNCREVAVGGGFGAKSKIGEHEAIASLLSMRTGRPVRSVLSRTEEFGVTKTRHGARTRLRLSCDDDGLLHFVEADVVFDNGAYNHYGPTVMKAGVHALGSLYMPDGLRFRARLVDTAKPPGGPYRGYGATQTLFALESAMDELAQSVKIDPLAFRLRNANKPNSASILGARVGTSGLAACLERVREELDWDRKCTVGVPWRGLGVASGMHGSGSYAFPGSNVSDAAVDLRLDGTATVRFGTADAGTGQRTILAQIAAEELGLDISSVDVVTMDSEATPVDMGSWSSRGTHYGGHATRQAAKELADHLRDLAKDKLGDGLIELGDGHARRVDNDDETVPIGELMQLSPRLAGDVISVETSYREDRVEAPRRDGRHNKSASYAFAAHGVEVAVDPVTGEITILRYVAAHDVGRPLNPTLVEGQVRGGVVMAIGAALGEELVHEGGRVVNTSFLTYPVRRSSDVPDIEVHLVGDPDPSGPYGAKSVGEIPMHPVGPAIANAVHAATGIRFTELPITPDKIVAALAQRDGSVRRHRLWRRPGRWWIAVLRWAYPRGVHYLLHRWSTKFAKSRRSVARIEKVTAVTEINETADLIDQGGMPLGGGTDILPRQDQSLPVGPHLVALSGVGELTTMRRAPDGTLRIGAAVTLSEFLRELGTNFPAVGQAIRTIATPQVRAVATVAGNLLQEKRCWFYRSGFDCYKRGGVTCPCYAVTGDHRFQHAAMGAHRCQAVTPSDLATVLMALNGSIVLRHGTTTRTVSMAALYTGPGETSVRSGEFIEAIELPADASKSQQSFHKLAMATGDFAIASVAVAAHIDAAGAWNDASVVLGAVAPVPWRARGVEQWLERCGGKLADLRHTVDAELNRHGHPLPGNAWKLDVVAGLVERACGEVVDAWAAGQGASSPQ